MKRTQKIALALAIATAAGIVLYMAKHFKTKHMLAQIAEEGYETAQDILFPHKDIHGKHLQYGPVIPEL
ncbi:MAG: hypothetical protein H7Z13_19855 [Ferruginibacter sp.]|nr:hypothetical protein [Ferruginibacter sp.]